MSFYMLLQILTFLLLPLFTLASPDLSKPSHSNISFCDTPQWETPQILSPGDIGTLRWLSVATSDTIGFFAGNSIPFFTSDSAPQRALYIGTLTGEAIPIPSGNFDFIFPKLLLDENDKLHMIWGERSKERPVTGRDWAHVSAYVTDLWTAVFDPAKDSWSTPAMLYRGESLYWSTRSSTVATSSPTGLQVVALDRNITSTKLLYLSKNIDEQWKTERVPIQLAAIYPSIAVTADGVVYVAYIGSDTTQQRDSNSVFLLESLDHGHSWKEPYLVQRSGNRRAFEVIPLIDSSNNLHLVWAQDTDGNGTFDAVRTSIRRGDTWSRITDLGVDEPFVRLNAAISSDDSILVLFHRIGDHFFSVWSACYRDGWSKIEQVFPEYEMADAQLFKTTRDQVSVVASGQVKEQLSPDDVSRTKMLLSSVPHVSLTPGGEQ